MSDSPANVPATLARLKARLLLNRARTTRGGIPQLLIAGALGAGAALFGAIAAISLAHSDDPRISVSTIVIGSTVLWLGWTFLPLLTFGTDETLDPARLQLLPVRRSPLMAGLLLSSVIGIIPLAAVVVLIATVAGYGEHGAFVVGIVAMALLLALCITSARTLSTVLSAGLSSRRGRDAAIVVASLLFLGLQSLRFVHLSIGPSGFLHASHVLRWTPAGMLGQAVYDARAGHWLRAVVQLIPAALLVPLLLKVWADALDHSMTVVVDGASRERRRGRREQAALPLVPRRTPWLASAPWGAVAARELRYFARDPRRKIMLLNAVIFGAGVPLYLSFRSNGSHSVVLLSTLAGWVGVVMAMNQFGFDGAGAWTDAAAGDTTRSVLIGKNAALAMTILPVITVVAVVIAAITKGWIYIPAALLLGLGGLGAGFASADVVSVRFPMRLPEGGSPFSGFGGGGGGGQGLSRAFVLLGCSLAQNLLLGPIVAAAVVGAAVAPVSLVVTAPLCTAYGAALWWAGVKTAGRMAQWRLPELLRAIDPAASDRR